MADGSAQPITLMVTFGDGSQMSLLDWLKQAYSIPPNDQVVVNGKTESVAEYQAWVQQQVNGILTQFENEMNVVIEDLSNLAGEMWFQSGAVSGIKSDLESALAGIHGAIGNDDLARQWWGTEDGSKPGFAHAYSVLKGNFDALSQSLSNMGGGLHTNANDVFATEQATVAGFGQTVTDPRYSNGAPRGSRGGNLYQ